MYSSRPQKILYLTCRKLMLRARIKTIVERLLCARFFFINKISRAFLRAKQVGKARESWIFLNVQNYVVFFPLESISYFLVVIVCSINKIKIMNSEIVWKQFFAHLIRWKRELNISFEKLKSRALPNLWLMGSNENWIARVSVMTSFHSAMETYL